MDTVTAVRNRILSLCGERGISINQLAALCALPPSSIKNILYPETERCRTPHGVRGLKWVRNNEHKGGIVAPRTGCVD